MPAAPGVRLTGNAVHRNGNGYTVRAEVALSFTAVADRRYARPGFANLRLEVTGSATVVNITTGREVLMGQGPAAVEMFWAVPTPGASDCRGARTDKGCAAARLDFELNKSNLGPGESRSYAVFPRQMLNPELAEQVADALAARINGGEVPVFAIVETPLDGGTPRQVPLVLA